MQKMHVKMVEGLSSEKSFSEDLFLKEITSFYNSDLNKRSKICSMIYIKMQLQG